MITETKTPLAVRISASKLDESAVFAVVAGHIEHNVVFDEMIGQWGDSPFAPLAALLTSTIAIARFHQSHHWQASGDPFYGDHLLFDRLYNAANEEIDTIAEKLVGLGGLELVNPVLQAQQVEKVITQVFAPIAPSAFPKSRDLMLASYAAEMHYLKFIKVCSDRLGEYLSMGTDNMLAQLADTHEGHLYLLQQRLLPTE